MEKQEQRNIPVKQLVAFLVMDTEILQFSPTPTRPSLSVMSSHHVFSSSFLFTHCQSLSTGFGLHIVLIQQWLEGCNSQGWVTVKSAQNKEIRTKLAWTTAGQANIKGITVMWQSVWK